MGEAAGQSPSRPWCQGVRAEIGGSTPPSPTQTQTHLASSPAPHGQRDSGLLEQLHLAWRGCDSRFSGVGLALAIVAAFAAALCYGVASVLQSIAARRSPAG